MCRMTADVYDSFSGEIHLNFNWLQLLRCVLTMEKIVYWNNRVGEVSIDRFTFLLFHPFDVSSFLTSNFVLRFFQASYSYQLAFNHLNHLIVLFTYTWLKTNASYFSVRLSRIDCGWAVYTAALNESKLMANHLKIGNVMQLFYEEYVWEFEPTIIFVALVWHLFRNIRFSIMISNNRPLMKTVL